MEQLNRRGALAPLYLGLILYQKVDMTFGACVAYLVDVMHSRSSEILATIESVLFIFTDFGFKGLNALFGF